MAHDLNNVLVKLKRHGIQKSFSLAVKKVVRVTYSMYWYYKTKKRTTMRCPFFIVQNFCDKDYFWKIDRQRLVAHADALVDKSFSLLGADFTFDFSDPLCWHTDYRLKKSSPEKDCYFDSKSFCHSIGIDCGATDTLEKDIKLAWELSRLQFLPVLAYAYKKTGLGRYYTSCRDYCCSWDTHNPFMYGANWVGPMEVALRVINLIWTYQIVSDDLFCDDQWQRSLHRMIYEHMIYLENHWEIYDGRTNNHYLSDLVGYLYCLWFFKSCGDNAHKLTVYFDLFCTELHKQVLPDGALYEGSAAYHCFVLELCDHIIFLAQECVYELSHDFYCLYKNMQRFSAACTSSVGLIKIGDDDSGFVLWPGDISPSKDHRGPQQFFFKNFGLSVYNNKSTHVTLRHARYARSQPTGHFHNDVLAVTLVYKGVPLLVDPGSYVYTASIGERNYFRSVYNHSTLSVDRCEQVPLSHEPFFLGLHESSAHEHDDLFCAHYAYPRALCKRRVQCTDSRVSIFDTVSLDTRVTDSCIVSWSFVCGCGVEVVCSENGEYLFWYNQRVCARLVTDIPFSIDSSWVSLGYGVKKRAVALCGECVCSGTVLFNHRFDLL